ncbi:glycosyltransferase [Pelosinus sp. UFO1]|uniref:glycosyltransferase n=1 Tax=Pelosinus sp. UFO1 TaxID=484770 RepID=UPI0004D1377D|nr:glycosyltransferase [Pelosinus sp. UFO1]AIF53716.1 glycosyl transferase family 2 [Pelosinus sp. UFO1]
MCKLPLVSVLVPAYNHERYIEECLNSIIHDDYPNKEIIIFDDGSSDNSISIVNAWINKNEANFPGRIFFKTCQNKGVTKTLNEMIKEACGEFITLVASDDYLLPDGISKRVDYLLKHTDLLAVFADCLVVDQQGNVLSQSGVSEYHKGRKKYLKDQYLLKYELIFRWCVPGPVFLARRKVYEEVGYYDERLIVEDWDFYLRLSKSNLLGFLDATVACYRIHSTNTSIGTSNKSEKYKNSMLITMKKNMEGLNAVQYMRLWAEMTMTLHSATRYHLTYRIAKLADWIAKNSYKLICKVRFINCWIRGT